MGDELEFGQDDISAQPPMGGELEFGQPPAEKQGPPQPLWSKAQGVAEDVAKSAVAGAGQGFFGLAGAPGSIESTVAQDIPTLARNVGYKIGKGLDILSPAEAETLQQQPLSWIPNDLTDAQKKGLAAPITGLPTYKGIVEKIKEGTSPEYATIPFGTYKPITPAGKVAEATSEGAMMAIPGGLEGLAPRMIQGALSGAGAEAANELTGNPYWTIAGGLGMGAVGAGLGHLASDSGALARDKLYSMVADGAKRGASKITPEDFQIAMENGVPLSVFHLLDKDSQKAFAKYANMSDDSIKAVNQFNTQLAASQAAGGERVSDFLKKGFNSDLYAPKIEDSAKDLAKAERDAVFSTARANPKADAIPNSIIGDDLMSHPLFKDAMKNANDNADILRDYNIVPPSIKPGTTSKWVQTEKGLVEQPGVPHQNISGNMNYWQQVKEELDGMHGAAQAANNGALASTIDTLRGNLKTRVGSYVPEYANALSVAHNGYMLQDATRAGYYFASNPNQFKINDIRKLANSYNDEQYNLFNQGIGSFLHEQAQKPNGIQSLAKKFSSDLDFQSRMKEALGQDAYNSVYGKIMSEELFRNADAVNIAQNAGRNISPTIGAGGIALAAGPLVDFTISHPEIMQHVGVGTAAGTAAATAIMAGSKILNVEQQRIANRLIPMVLSSDPSAVAQAGKILDKSWQAKNAVSSVINTMQKAAGATVGRAIKLSASPTGRVLQSIPTNNPPPPQQSAGGRVPRKSGGKVQSGHQHLVDRLFRLGEQAKKAEKAHTEPLLNLPDETVAKALDVAQRAI